MGYTFYSLASIIKYSVKHQILLAVFQSGELQAWDPYPNQILYCLDDPFLMRISSQEVRRYLICSFTVNEQSDHFILGGTNGAIQVRHVKSGRLLRELMMSSSNHVRARLGEFNITLVEEVKGIVYVGGNHEHIVEFDLNWNGHRYDWLQRVSSPITYGILVTEDVIMSLHSNGDLVYWHRAYREVWMKLSMRGNVADLRKANGIRRRYVQLKKSLRSNSEHMNNVGVLNMTNVGVLSKPSSRQPIQNNVGVLSVSSSRQTKEKNMCVLSVTSSRQTIETNVGVLSVPSLRQTIEDLRVIQSYEIEGDNISQGSYGSRKTMNAHGEVERKVNEVNYFSKSEKSNKSAMTNERNVSESKDESLTGKPAAQTNFDVRAFVMLRKNRPLNDPTVGNLLLLKAESKYIYCWNIYGFLSRFPISESVCWLGAPTCARVDPEEMFLFIASERGFVRTYYIENYANPYHPERRSRVQLRAMFPCLWKSLHKTITERKGKGPTEVPLVNNYRAHLASITSMEFLTGKQILVTGGKDKVIRLWHVSGVLMSQLDNSADAAWISRQDVGLYDVPPGPYILPMFMERYPAGKTFGQWKVMYRNWTKDSLTETREQELLERARGRMEAGVGLSAIEEYSDHQPPRAASSSSSCSLDDGWLMLETEGEPPQFPAAAPLHDYAQLSLKHFIWNRNHV